jgi:hypothetical protein
MKIRILNYLFSLLILAFAISCSGQQIKTSLEQLDLKGRVSKLTVRNFSFSMKFGEPVKEMLNHSNEYEFDTRGNIIKFSHYDKTGELQSRDITKYDEEGRKFEVRKYFPSGALKSKEVYFYYENGYPSEEFYYDEHGTLLSKVVCDDEGRRRSSFTYNEEGKVKEQTKYEYDSIGAHVKTLEFDSKGVLKNSRTPIKYKLAPGYELKNFSSRDEMGNWRLSNNTYEMIERDIYYY